MIVLENIKVMLEPEPLMGMEQCQMVSQHPRNVIILILDSMKLIVLWFGKLFRLWKPQWWSHQTSKPR